MLYTLTVAGLPLGLLFATALMRTSRRAAGGWLIATAALCLIDGLRYGPLSAGLTALLALLGVTVGAVLTMMVREFRR